MVTKEELAQMSLAEKVRHHAQNVVATENSRQLGLRFQRVNAYSGVSDDSQATYPAGEGEFIYDFLLGGGSLGHPMQPTEIGQAVYRVAELVGAKVSFLDFTYARFNKKITPEVVEKAFYPIWEKSERMKSQERK